MTDLKKRSSLKFFATTAAALALPAGTIALAARSKKRRERLGISVHVTSGSDRGTVVFDNPARQDVMVEVKFNDDIKIPGGRLDVRQLSAMGPVHIEAGSIREFELPKLARTQNPTTDAQGYHHSDQGFPITANVIIDTAQVKSDRPTLNGKTPIYLVKARKRKV